MERLLEPSRTRHLAEARLRAPVYLQNIYVMVILTRRPAIVDDEACGIVSKKAEIMTFGSESLRQHDSNSCSECRIRKANGSYLS
jgi:hypothetical protein